MAKRVFEIARDLGVKSKAILEKCQAEGIPNMNNHMSSVSAGLEATIRDWFSQGESKSSTETAAAVDLEKVKAAPKKKAKAKATKKPVTVPEEPGSSDDILVPSFTPAPVEVTHPSVPEEPTPAEIAAKATEPTSDGNDADAPPAPEQPTAQPNVPNKPEIVKPAGPQLEVQTPAKLSGPKVVRIEAPDPDRAPRQRTGPRMGGHGGVRQGGGRGAGPVAPPPDPSRGDPGRGGRNKRRSGPGDNKRTQQPAKKGLEPASRDWKPGAWREQDLVEREARLSRAGGYLRQRRRELKRKQQTGGERALTAAETGGTVKINAPFTIKDLSAATGVKSSEVIKKLFLQGIAASVNSAIESEKAMEIMLEYDIELEIDERKSAEEVVEQQFAEREAVDERPRSPVVTILGHVDHGKTSLLDRIRNANVADGEAGGITQATSAFRVPVSVADKEERLVVFFDTPGHEAFTAMRARGATITDIVVLVVAADDGVMPQTAESISHAKAAGVPIIVALNKIDKPEATDANIQKIYGELAEHGLNPVEWGGETEVVKTSAIENTGITDLLEILDYQAELLELKADFGGPSRGTVIESQVIQGRGSVASILVQDGTLNVGDFIVCGRAFGRVRDITNDRGDRIKEAGPAMPVQISGLDTIPDAGDKFYIVDSLKKAEDAAEQRREHERETELAQPKVTLESMLGQLKAGETKELRVLIKADVQGSLDVLKKTSEEIQNDEVRVRVLHAAVGGITESDVLLADASKAVIIGFNVIPSGKARKEAEKQNIEIRTYDVIYDIVDDLKKAAEGLLTPELRQEVIGHAEVREVFKISKVGAVAGCYVTDGSIERNAFIRVTRDDIVIENDRLLEQLKRFKDDAKEVRAGQECGMKIVGYDDIKQGDVLECYRRIEVKRTL